MESAPAGVFYIESLNETLLTGSIVAIMIRRMAVRVAMDRIKQMEAEEEAKDDRVL